MNLKCPLCKSDNEVSGDAGKKLFCGRCRTPLNITAELAVLNRQPWHFIPPTVANLLQVVGVLTIVGGILACIFLLLSGHTALPGAAAVAAITLINTIVIFAWRRIVISSAESAHNTRNLFRLLAERNEKPEPPAEQDGGSGA